MVYEHDKSNEGLDIINEDTMEDDTDMTDEVTVADTLKALRTKLKNALAEKRDAQEELQRAKADFLNARKRLTEERDRDRLRQTAQFVESLLPVCDSFEMAMNNTTVWESVDPSWRAGVESIHKRLNRLLENYEVTVSKPLGETFDPNKHEALNTEIVIEKSAHDTITKVLQSGYSTKSGATEEIIRPARVTIGVFEEVN